MKDIDYIHIDKLHILIFRLPVKSVFRKYLVGFMLLFILQWQSAMGQTTSREYFRVAKYKMEHGDFQSALDFINSAIMADTTYMNAYLLRSEINYELGHYTSTIKDIDKAFRLDPQKSKYMSKYYLLRGKAYRKINDLEAAKRDVDKTITIKDKNAEAYYERAILYSEKGKYREALQDLNKAIELYPDNAGYYAERSKIKQVLFKPLPGTPGFTSMFSDINVAIALDQDNYEYYKFRFHLMKEQKTDTRTLMKEVDSIISRFPDHAEMYVERGILFMNEYDYQEAVKNFSLAIGMNEKNEAVYRYRALCYHNLNKTGKAIQDYSVSIKMLEDQLASEQTNNTGYENILAKTYVQRGYSYQISGRNQEACRDFLRAYNLGSKTGLNYYKKFCRGF